MQCPAAHALIIQNQTQSTKIGSPDKSRRWSQVTFKSCSFLSKVIIPKSSDSQVYHLSYAKISYVTIHTFTFTLASFTHLILP